MNDVPRFKIDMSDSSIRHYALFFRKKRLFWSGWEYITSFETREQAREYYERLKDLPEYLP